jgi:hypothetical protein
MLLPWVAARCAFTHGYGRQLRFAREHIEPLRGSPASFSRIAASLSRIVCHDSHHIRSHPGGGLIDPSKGNRISLAM